MNYIPYYSLFSITLLSGTLISLSSNHWIYVWIGFEVNLISFVPLILYTSTNQETEAAVNYFLTQALGSSLILLSALSATFSPFSILPANFIPTSIIFALITNIGAAPFHFWLPQVIASISWISCLILATWQNIAPLSIISSISSTISNESIIFLAATGALIGGVGGLNQTHLRPLLAYSSIGHLGWIMAASIISLFSTVVYFLIYAATTAAIIWSIHSNNTNSNRISSLTNSPIALSLSLIILFLSLGGLPPLLGFLPNWIIINSIISQNILIFIFPIIMGSLISLFYYISLYFNLFSNYITGSYNNITQLPLTADISILVTITLGLIPIVL